MHLEPIIPDFDYARIRKTGGFVGVDQTVNVDRYLTVSVADRHAGDRVFELDAAASLELMQALATLVQVNPAPSTRTGFDLFHYDVELSIGGRIHTFHSVDLGADEALHGVMLAASRVAKHDSTTLHTMALHLQPKAPA